MSIPRDSRGLAAGRVVMMMGVRLGDMLREFLKSPREHGMAR